MVTALQSWVSDCDGSTGCLCVRGYLGLQFRVIVGGCLCNLLFSVLFFVPLVRCLPLIDFLKRGVLEIGFFYDEVWDSFDYFFLMTLLPNRFSDCGGAS